MTRGVGGALRAYASLFRIRFIAGLQYRVAAAAGILTQVVWGVMEVLLFRAFLAQDAAAFPMSMAQLSSYVWLQQAFLTLFMTWFLDNDLFHQIRTGDVALSLARPMSLYGMWWTRNAALRAGKAALRAGPVLLFAALLPAPYGLSAPASLAAALGFAATMLLGFCVILSFCMLIYCVTFWTLSPLGVRMVALSLTEFLTGGIVPLPFLPDGIRRALEWLPFAAMQNVPLRVYSGQLAGAEALRAAALQCVWLAALTALGVWLMRRALRKLVVHGG